jgi:hypothetical protein
MLPLSRHHWHPTVKRETLTLGRAFCPLLLWVACQRIRNSVPFRELFLLSWGDAAKGFHLPPMSCIFSRYRFETLWRSDVLDFPFRSVLTCRRIDSEQTMLQAIRSRIGKLPTSSGLKSSSENEKPQKAQGMLIVITPKPGLTS